uniref:Uncharacterized protein n=1 Tax=Arundo donax TaxID=35708 RepID=A0A0A9CCY4_ARUDO
MQLMYLQTLVDTGYGSKNSCHMARHVILLVWLLFDGPSERQGTRPVLREN